MTIWKSYPMARNLLPGPCGFRFHKYRNSKNRQNKKKEQVSVKKKKKQLLRWQERKLTPVRGQKSYHFSYCQIFGSMPNSFLILQRQDYYLHLFLLSHFPCSLPSSLFALKVIKVVSIRAFAAIFAFSSRFSIQRHNGYLNQREKVKLYQEDTKKQFNSWRLVPSVGKMRDCSKR